MADDIHIQRVSTVLENSVEGRHSRRVRAIQLSGVAPVTYRGRTTIFFTVVRRVRHRAVTTIVGLAPPR
jgi:hypothetical protein